LHSPQITELIGRLAKLTGLGRKSVTRLSLYILKWPEDELKWPEVEVTALAASLVEVKEEIRLCSLCHDYTEQVPCPRCSDPRRERSAVSSVETLADLMTIESARLSPGPSRVGG
jgi:recombination protein RecR